MSPPKDPNLRQLTWRRREIENTVSDRFALLGFAAAQGARHQGPLFASLWRKRMEQCIGEIESSLETLGKPSPWSPDIKASDEFLDPLFRRFYRTLGLPNLMRKSNYSRLVLHLTPDRIDDEVGEKLDAILSVARG